MNGNPSGARCMECEAPLEYDTGVYIINHETWCHHVKKEEPKKQPSDKKGLFLDAWIILVKSGLYGDLPMPVGEYRFYPKRRWQFDWAFEDQMVAVEVDGRAKWVKGGGSHAQDTDREKHNMAAQQGWTTFRYSTDMLKQDPAACAAQVAYVIMQRINHENKTT